MLWELIESYRVDIFDVTLNRITQDFLDFIRRAEELHIELASSFAMMASRLLYYKSKALLPDPGFEEAEEEKARPKRSDDRDMILLLDVGVQTELVSVIDLRRSNLI